MAAILLIEDDPHQRAFAAMVLAEAGHQVREAPEGQEGLRLALAEPPELIVCDVVMPGMNGYQLVSAVRREPAICTTPVILLTWLAGRAQIRVGMTAGADDYLPKPFQPAELLEAVDALLQRRKIQYDAIAGSLMQDMDAALEQQREVLAARYESQLLEKINDKWQADVAAGGELAFAEAVLLVADLFSVVERGGAGRAGLAPVPGPTLQRAQAVRALARTQGWAVGAVAGLARQMPADVAVQGRSASGTGAAEGTVRELLRSRG